MQERGSPCGPRVLAEFTEPRGTGVHPADGPVHLLLQIICGPGLARQQAPLGLVSLLRDIRARCASETLRKGVHAGSLSERLGRGRSSGGLPQDVPTLCSPGVL